MFVDVFCAPTPRLLERIRQHALDVALTSVAEAEAKGDVIRHEPLVWVGREGDEAGTRAPLQLALSDPDTLDHRAACAALASAGRPYRVAYASGSISGLLAVVRSGQAIAVLTQAAVPGDLRILGAAEALPALPSVGLTVQCDLARPPALVAEFAAHLRGILPML